MEPEIGVSERDKNIGVAIGVVLVISLIVWFVIAMVPRTENTTPPSTEKSENTTPPSTDKSEPPTYGNWRLTGSEAGDKQACHEIRLTLDNKPISDLSSRDLQILGACRAEGF